VFTGSGAENDKRGMEESSVERPELKALSEYKRAEEHFL
jgi:hypothetical protein